uniref:KIAA1549-like b n=1 Tax=Paramormyrops kingsleyae TaxID=1676925 RepID=A0A3B3QQP0_9TELE
MSLFLRFVGPGDDITSCAFVQSMEQRLESVFTEAQSKVLNSSAKLSVQILAAWQLPLSQAVALTYVVRNGSESLNGTVSSGLLGQLSAELVGYFLFYPPLRHFIESTFNQKMFLCNLAQQILLCVLSLITV